ncbi:MAG: AMP-binding protein, partial [Proteobacteria bacterium]|nr:AMP-binding protein [Pseudomonadota bacterium]
MEVKRTFDILEQYHAKFKKDQALAGVRKGEWYFMSSEEYYQKAHYVSYALLELGLSKGDKIATVSNNRPEWNVFDMGIAMAGMVHVPIYPTISERSFKYVLEHSEAKLLIISSNDLYEIIKPIIPEVPAIKFIYSIETIEQVENLTSLFNLGKLNEDKFKSKLETIKSEIGPNTLVTIIYTSGTTGVPKGVMLSHNNFISNVKASVARFSLTHEHKVLSFLPLNHVYERMVNYQYQFKGLTIYYAESMETIGDNLKEIKPHGFATVPRLLEKVYDKIMTKGKTLSYIKRTMLHWAISLAIKYEPDDSNGFFYNAQLKIANKLVFSKWREALGGN